jgi:hypothetical protein
MSTNHSHCLIHCSASSNCAVILSEQLAFQKQARMVCKDRMKVIIGAHHRLIVCSVIRDELRCLATHRNIYYQCMIQIETFSQITTVPYDLSPTCRKCFVNVEMD